SHKEEWQGEGPFRHHQGDQRIHQYTIIVYKCIRGVGVTWVFREIQEFATREMGTLDGYIDTRCNKAPRANSVRTVSSHFGTLLSRKCNDTEDPPDKLRFPVYLSPLSKIYKKKTTQKTTDR
ncbi:unnamed protein product, partial [Gulo gulo]